jgi:hypothetical protein
MMQLPMESIKTLGMCVVQISKEVICKQDRRRIEQYGHNLLPQARRTGSRQ